MDNSNQSVAPTAPIPANSTNIKTYFSRLFNGRLNRSGNVLGIVTVAGAVTVISMILFSGLILISNPVVARAIPLVLAFIVVLFYLFSLSLRRLHDLNRSGWWLLLFLPGEIGTIIFLSANFVPSLQTEIISILKVIPPFIDTIFTVMRWITNAFSLYMLLWPGTDGVNNYGAPTASWGIKEVLGFREPKLQEVAPEETTETIAV